MTPNAANLRLLCADVLAEPVQPDGASRALRTASVTLAQTDRTDVGLWEAGPGTDVDVEADEVFVVLSGAGVVAFEDGSSIALRPGMIVHLHEGDRTTWTVTERLRKLYLAWRPAKKEIR